MSSDPEATLPERDASPTASDKPIEQGSMVGRYVVLSPLGTGSMGMVYAAHDPELDRKVALKVVRPDAERSSRAPSRRRRLLREAQALARLDHPNVVSIYDVGMMGERIWIAMELIEGQTLARWREARRRTWSEVVDVLIPAGRGLIAAHEAGLMHRDFKPDNVMIDDAGRIRVMDFGLARAQTGSGAELSIDQTDADDIGRMFGGDVVATMGPVGTPAYMSAEQARGEADARSDQFSFCVTLWEMLYGTRPFAAKSLAEMTFAVMEGKLQEPPKDARVPRWLRAIVERGLRSEPEERFDRMNDLLRAIERGQARSGRRRWLLGLGVLGLVVAGVWGVQQLDRAQRIADCEADAAGIDAVWNDAARQQVREALLATEVSYAPTTVERVLPLIDAQAQAWSEARSQLCMDATVHTAREPGQYARALWCLEERYLELSSLVGELSRADALVVQRATGAASGLGPVSACGDPVVLAALPDPPESAQRDAVTDLRAELAQARGMQRAGKFESGLERARAVRDQAEQLGWPPLVSAALLLEGRLLEDTGAFEEAEQVDVQAYRQSVESGSWETATRAAENLIYLVGVEQARHNEGRGWASHAELTAGFAGDPTGLREANCAVNLATIHLRAGEYAMARSLFQRALMLREQTLGLQHVEVSHVINNLAIVYDATGDHDEALQLLQRGLDIRERALGADHPEVGTSLANLGAVYHGMGDSEQAQRFFERAMKIQTEALGAQHPDVITTMANLAVVHRTLGQYEPARQLLEQVLELREAQLGPEHPSVATMLHNLGKVLVASGQAERAMPLHERGLAIRQKALGAEHPHVAASMTALAETYLARGRPEDARSLLEDAVERLFDSPEGTLYRPEAQFHLARSLQELGSDPARVETLTRQAAAELRGMGPAGARLLSEVEAWRQRPKQQPEQ